MIIGTPAYMAPEQARGEPVDQRADIYAVGAILYCALTGKRPFERKDPTSTLTAVLTEDPVRPRLLEPSIPDPLELVIQRAMAKSPQDRYQSMAELEAVLAAYDAPDLELQDESPSLSVTKPMVPRPGTSTSLEQQTREVNMARPLILLLATLGLFWVVGSLVTLIASVIRVIRGPATNLTGSESVLLIGGILIALSTPLWLAVRHLRTAVWGNSVKALTLADRMKSPVMIGLVAYGLGSLLVRFIEVILVRRASGVAWPVWDMLLALIGAGAALTAYKLDESERTPKS
jgi:serine/threonine-protein kinase